MISEFKLELLKACSLKDYYLSTRDLGIVESTLGGWLKRYSWLYLVVILDIFSRILLSSCKVLKLVKINFLSKLKFPDTLSILVYIKTPVKFEEMKYNFKPLMTFQNWRGKSTYTGEPFYFLCLMASIFPLN